MKKYMHVLFWLLLFIFIKEHTCFANESDYGKNIVFDPNEIHIASNAIFIPINRFIIARKDGNYCAIKFNKFWSENKTQKGTVFVASGADEYASYVSYFQGDKTGDFGNKNVKINKGKLSRPKPRGIGRLAFSFGDIDIDCGSFNLMWSGRGWVYFFGSGQEEGDYGIELAPTNWTDISQINVYDNKLAWTRYKPCRERINIPVEQIWYYKDIIIPQDTRPSENDEVIIGAGDITMPIARILLVRKESITSALKFNSYGKKNRDEYYACYVSYRQRDKSLNLSSQNSEYSNGIVFRFEGPLPVNDKSDRTIHCGKINILWESGGTINFGSDPDEFDDKIEFAPTKWADISEVNVSDPGLKWYRYDNHRKQVVIPIKMLQD